MTLHDQLAEAKQRLTSRPQAQICRFPLCSTLTLRGLCPKHRPTAEWQISEELRNAIDGEQRQNGGKERK